MNPIAREIIWHRGHGFEDMYVAEVDGRRWRIRLGDFPDESLYTLYVDDAEVARFDDWPPAWRKP